VRRLYLGNDYVFDNVTGGYENALPDVNGASIMAVTSGVLCFLLVAKRYL
jgi:hypothetical protein